ncbi:MAG: fructose-6-phosphate aldolase [Candidatus Gracilibacteria bacterium]|nr:fructose-6-phosphate aldolase [Candidatus Gracilibacteria bacterium]
MKIFLDTANLDEIKKYAEMGIVDGVTTNPTLVAKEGANLKEYTLKICEMVDGDISAEVIATDYEGIVKEGREIAKWHKNVVVKIPFIPEGVKAIKTLSSEGIKINCTLIFSANQALLAAKAGAYIVSPFAGRIDDMGQDSMQTIAEIRQIFDNYGIECQILFASTRHPRHVVDAATMGCDICTMPAGVLEKMFKHPLTDKGLTQFLSDWEAVKDKQ